MIDSNQPIIKNGLACLRQKIWRSHPDVEVNGQELTPQAQTATPAREARFLNASNYS